MTKLADKKKLDICVVAYACKPHRGSEDGIGWGWTIGLSKYANVTLITRMNNVSSICDELSFRGAKTVDVIGVDLPVWLRCWKRGPLFAMTYHYIWQLLAARYVNRISKNTFFDFCLHLNFATSWQPCWLAFYTKAIYGPIDGDRWIPPSYWGRIGLKNAILEVMRAIRIWLGENIDPFARLSFYKCELIICRHKFIAKRLMKKGWNISGIIPDTCLDEPFINKIPVNINKQVSGKKVKLIFAGRLVSRKGVFLALEAVEKVLRKNKNIEFTILGDGPEMSRLTELSKRLSIDNYVVFKGKVSTETLLSELLASDIFIYPSLRDAVCAVVQEAMAAGLPVICLDGIGPAQAVTKDKGIAVRMESNVKETVNGLAAAINKLVEEEQLRIEMGKNARSAVAARYSCDSRARMLLELYEKHMSV